MGRSPACGILGVRLDIHNGPLWPSKRWSYERQPLVNRGTTLTIIRSQGATPERGSKTPCSGTGNLTYQFFGYSGIEITFQAHRDQAMVRHRAQREGHCSVGSGGCSPLAVCATPQNQQHFRGKELKTDDAISSHFPFHWYRCSLNVTKVRHF